MSKCWVNWPRTMAFMSNLLRKQERYLSWFLFYFIFIICLPAWGRETHTSIFSLLLISSLWIIFSFKLSFFSSMSCISLTLFLWLGNQKTLFVHLLVVFPVCSRRREIMWYIVNNLKNGYHLINWCWVSPPATNIFQCVYRLNMAMCTDDIDCNKVSHHIILISYLLTELLSSAFCS